MSEMNGLDVLRIVLDTDEVSEIPFIFSSSMSEKIDRATAMKLGADDYITKPFEPESLLLMAKDCIAIGGKRLKLQNM